MGHVYCLLTLKNIDFLILSDFISWTMEEPGLFWINERIIYTGTEQPFQRSQKSNQGH